MTAKGSSKSGSCRRQRGNGRILHSDIRDLEGRQGSFNCVAPSTNNHGPVGVVNSFRFAYADGTPYLPVGTTCYVWNLQGDELEEQTLRTLDQAPFNKLRMCVFPKRYTFNMNEPLSYPFPGEVTQTGDPAMMQTSRTVEPPNNWDFSRFNPGYFQHLKTHSRLAAARHRS